jgi:hypothetical protein
VKKRFSFSKKNPPQPSEILKSKNEALKLSKRRAFMQNFSSLAYTQKKLNKFLTYFQENLKKNQKNS